jgi:CheY-like chemotaxis protein
VTSVPAQGTTFHLLIPASEKVVESDAQPVQARHRGCGKILVMDDEEMVRYVLKAMLERLGYEVIETRDGQEAQERCEQLRELGEAPKAMLLDLTVPGGIGGTEAAPNLRKLFPDTPLIAASGYSQDPIMSKPLEFGFNDSISKPMRLIDLERVLDANLNVSKQDSDPKH